MKKQLMPVMVLVICAAFVGAGCGGDDDETTTATTTEAGASGASGASGEEGAAAGGGLLPDDFAEEANAVCVEGNERIEAEAGEIFGGGGEPSKADQEKFAEDVLVPEARTIIEEMRALGEPDEGAEEFSAVIDDAESVTDDVEKDPSLISGKDDPYADVNQQLKELGVPACSEE